MIIANPYRALLCALAIATPAGAQEPALDTGPSPEAFAREWLQAWNSRDVDRILTHYTEDALFEDVPGVGNGWDVPLRGREEMRESLAATFEEMSDLQFELVSTFGAGDHMAVEWVMTGSHFGEATGEFSIRAVSVLELEGGRIASERDYYDAYLLLRRLNLAPDLGAEAAGGDP